MLFPPRCFISLRPTCSSLSYAGSIFWFYYKDSKCSLAFHLCVLGGFSCFLWGWNNGTKGHRFSYITLYNAKYIFFLLYSPISYIRCSTCSLVPLGCKSLCFIKFFGVEQERAKRGTNFFLVPLKTGTAGAPLAPCSTVLFHLVPLFGHKKRAFFRLENRLFNFYLTNFSFYVKI